MLWHTLERDNSDCPSGVVQLVRARSLEHLSVAPEFELGMQHSHSPFSLYLD